MGAGGTQTAVSLTIVMSGVQFPDSHKESLLLPEENKNIKKETAQAESYMQQKVCKPTVRPVPGESRTRTKAKTGLAAVDCPGLHGIGVDKNEMYISPAGFLKPPRSGEITAVTESRMTNRQSLYTPSLPYGETKRDMRTKGRRGWTGGEMLRWKGALNSVMR